MATKTLLPLVASAIAACSLSAAAQTPESPVIISESESVSVIEVPECEPHYYNSWRDGWFVQAGAGVNITAFEGFRYNPVKVAAVYNAGFGRWFSPYLGFRFSAYYGNMIEDTGASNIHFRSASINADLMWDMFNSIGGVNLSRPVSVVPFVGVGGTYNYHFSGNTRMINVDENGPRHNTWMIPVSAGLQVRFRLCRYVDLFLEGRAIFAGDNFNNVAEGAPIDMAFQGTGGITVNIGGKAFKTYDPCASSAYMTALNNQVNNLRDELAVTSAALAAAESQLPCPEVQPAPVAAPVEAAPAPMLTTVRFTINSSRITPMEMVNVYNVAEYMKQYPKAKITITGYADKDTGSTTYNQQLSERRAQAVYDVLVNNYGISADRLTKAAEGSTQQPYQTNNWNRIVIFSQQ